MAGFNWIDGLIVIVYLIAITLFGVRFRKKQQSIHTYFLGGKSIPTWALSLSIVATETSTLTIIGTPGIAFDGDLSFLQLVMGYMVGRVFICLVLIPAGRGQAMPPGADQPIEQRACDVCGARLYPGADWCGLCLARTDPRTRPMGGGGGSRHLPMWYPEKPLPPVGIVQLIGTSVPSVRSSMPMTLVHTQPP